MLLQGGIDALGTGQAFTTREHFEIGLLLKGPLALCLFEDLLLEEWHLRFCVGEIEFDQILQRADLESRSPCQILVQTGFELIQQDLVFGVVIVTLVGDVGWIDHFRGQVFQCKQCLSQQKICPLVEPRFIARHTQSDTGQVATSAEAGVIRV